MLDICLAGYVKPFIVLNAQFEREKTIKIDIQKRIAISHTFSNIELLEISHCRIPNALIYLFDNIFGRFTMKNYVNPDDLL